MLAKIEVMMINTGEAKNRGKQGRKAKHHPILATVGPISITFWSPFYTYYIPFRSSGSQESNASNGVQIGVETKKLWSLQENWTELSGNFAHLNPRCEKFRTVRNKVRKFRTPLFKVRNSFQRANSSAKISLLLDTILKHFLELKLCIWYVILNLGKSGIHCFKRCMIWIWNEKVMAVLRQMVQSAKISHLEIQSAKNPFQGAKFFFKVRKCPNVF